MSKSYPIPIAVTTRGTLVVGTKNIRSLRSEIADENIEEIFGWAFPHRVAALDRAGKIKIMTTRAASKQGMVIVGRFPDVPQSSGVLKIACSSQLTNEGE